jgi:hypothetical protein
MICSNLREFLESSDLIPVILFAQLPSQGHFTPMTKELAKDDEKLGKFVKTIGKYVKRSWRVKGLRNK